MRTLVILLAAAGILSGCVGYAVPYNHDDHRPRHDANDRYHDRDRDGVPDRVDRDRDGDGVPNRRDSRPDNPNR